MVKYQTCSVWIAKTQLPVAQHKLLSCLGELTVNCKLHGNESCLLICPVNGYIGNPSEITVSVFSLKKIKYQFMDIGGVGPQTTLSTFFVVPH